MNMDESRKHEPFRGTITRRGLLRGAGAFTGAALIGGAWDCTAIQTRQNKIFVPNWDADGFRVLQISDLHANTLSQSRRAKQAVQMGMRHKVDLIALTGDFLDDYNPTTQHQLSSVLADLGSANCPVVAIFGNHDWGDCPTHELEELIHKSPAKLLRNRKIEVRGVTVAGIDDALFGKSDLRFLGEGVNSKSLLALWHEPDTVDRLPEPVSLQLSGHSHGGEVCLPGGIPIHTPRLAKKYTGGFYGSAKVPLFVSKGVATVGPCRLYCPPEIAIHTIFSSQGGPARIEAA